MKSRGKFVIILLQWLRLYTLGSRGSRELKTFLEIHLISSRIDQKLKNKKGEYMLLKENFARTSWPIDAVVGAISLGGIVASIPRRIDPDLAVN